MESPYKPPRSGKPPLRRAHPAARRPVITRAGLLVSFALAVLLIACLWWLRARLVDPEVGNGATESQASAHQAFPQTSDGMEQQESLDASQIVEPELGDPVVESAAAESAAVDVDVPAFSREERMGSRTGSKKVAIVIDDLGRSVLSAKRFMALGVPMSFAVLPFEMRTQQVVEALHKGGVEVLCHLPMQGLAQADPGPGALVAQMSLGELRGATEAALDAVVGARGVNNHMGSVLSTDAVAMQAVLEVVRERGKFFLDSRTSAESVGFQVARSLGLPAAQRQVFLDGDATVEAIRVQFKRALSIASKKGFAIAIGHPYDATLAILAQELPQAQSDGFEFVQVSQLLEGTGDQVERSPSLEPVPGSSFD